ncbi:MAG TPA: LSm family protein, partial [Candidatus Lokiarchaeia archaeon]|nr:LSm family protein [Candidatus Lokiarchaeia archaeon]
MTQNQFLVQEDLNHAIGKRVLLKLRSKNIQFAGVLERFDQHLNLYLRDAVETINGHENIRPHVILRGDS